MRTDPTISDIPHIELEKEDREAYRKQKTPPPKTPENDKTGRSGVSGFWLFLTFLVALGASGASYWLYEQNRQMQITLTDARERIGDLESQLSATGEQMGESAIAMQAKVTALVEKTDTLWDEMDKLWASAWRKNQSQLKGLGTQVQKDTAAMQSQINGFETNINVNATTLGVLQEQVDVQVAKANELAASLQQVAKSGSEADIQLANLREMLVAADRTTSALTRRIAAIEKWQKEEQGKPKPTVSSAPPPAPAATPVVE